MELAAMQATELHIAKKGQETTQVVHRLQRSPQKPQTQQKPCYRCGKVGHSSEKCFYKSKDCRNCGKRGHIAHMCKDTSRTQTSKVTSETTDTTEALL